MFSSRSSTVSGPPFMFLTYFELTGGGEVRDKGLIFLLFLFLVCDYFIFLTFIEEIILSPHKYSLAPLANIS